MTRLIGSDRPEFVVTQLIGFHPVQTALDRVNSVTANDEDFGRIGVIVQWHFFQRRAAYRRTTGSSGAGRASSAGCRLMGAGR